MDNLHYQWKLLGLFRRQLGQWCKLSYMLAPTDIDFDKLGKIYTMKINVFQKLNEIYKITVLVNNMGDTDQTIAISLGNSHFEDYFPMDDMSYFSNCNSKQQPTRLLEKCWPWTRPLAVYFCFLSKTFLWKNHLSLSRVDNGYEHVSSLEDDVACSEYAFRCPKGWHETGKFTSITMVSIRMFVDNMYGFSFWHQLTTLKHGNMVVTVPIVRSTQKIEFIMHCSC